MASTMTRTSGSVPEGRNSTRPLSPNSRLAAVTAALTAGSMAARVLWTPCTLTITWGSLVMTEARSASVRPVRTIRAARCSAVRTPSPVVAYSLMIT